MSFTGIHVVCAYIGTNGQLGNQATLLRKPRWSQSLPSPGTTTFTAPPGNERGGGYEHGGASLSISAAVDAFIAIGAAPDASQASGEDDSARLLIRAGDTQSMFVAPGDKVAWIAA